MNNATRFPARRKRPRAEVVEINQPITRKPVNRETRSIFVKVVREQIARAWWRGVAELDLASMYRVSRPEIERIVREELFTEKGAA